MPRSAHASVCKRRATNAAESGPHDGNLAAAQAEATMVAASIASRKQKVKRTGLVVFLALVALRVGFFIARGGAAAPPEIKGVGGPGGDGPRKPLRRVTWEPCDAAVRFRTS
jgi:hypothetical protein